MSEQRYGQVTLPEILRRAIDARLADVRVSLPGTIQKFNPATQLADVRPDLEEIRLDEQDTEIVEALPVISHVPCVFPSAGGFSLTFPVNEGDPCLLVFSDRSIDKWIDSGGLVDPVDLRRHHLSDAIAILGVHSKAQAIPSFDTDHATIGKDGSSSDFVALAQKVHDEIDSIRSAVETLCTHTHEFVGTGVLSPLTQIPPGPVGSVASETVKIKG